MVMWPVPARLLPRVGTALIVTIPHRFDLLGWSDNVPIPAAILGRVGSHVDPAVSAVTVVTIVIMPAPISVGEWFARVSDLWYQQER